MIHPANQTNVVWRSGHFFLELYNGAELWLWEHVPEDGYYPVDLRQMSLHAIKEMGPQAFYDLTLKAAEYGVSVGTYVPSDTIRAAMITREDEVTAWRSL